MSADVSDMCTELANLANMVTSVEIEKIDMSEELDTELVEWYESRFKMLKEDGVPNAITSYIEKAANAAINNRTKATIIQKALDYC